MTAFWYFPAGYLAMTQNRNSKSERASADAQTKLRRLLETERELEAILKETRREAEVLVESARAAADERVRMFETQLASEDEELRERVARDRDETIDSIREQAREETERLDGLDPARLDALSRYVVDLLIGAPDSGGRR
jgi:vacuolar-type H+-ATPase subunit H